MSTLATLLETNTTKDVTAFLRAIIGDGTTHGPLMWGGRIYRWAATLSSTSDPALSLLRTVIMADSARILANLSDPEDDLIMKVFDDVPGMYDGTDGVDWSSIDYARWLFEKNSTYEDGVPSGEHSNALSLLTDYIAGDLHDTHNLLHAITSRVWRNLDGEDCDALRLATFVLHTYAIYYNGWSPYTSLRNGLKDLHLRYLAGKPITTAGEHEWHTPTWKSPDGTVCSSFPIHPPFTPDFLESQGTTIDHTWTVQIGDDILQFADYGDDGVAITTRADDKTFVHFLGFPDEYNLTISAAFNIASYGDDYLYWMRNAKDVLSCDESEVDSIADESDIVSIVESIDNDLEHKESYVDKLQMKEDKLLKKDIANWLSDGFLHSYFTLL